MQKWLRMDLESALAPVSPRTEPRLTHQALYRLNLRRLRPADPTTPFEPEVEIRTWRVEEAFLRHERRAVVARASDAPTDARAFTRWFASLRQDGPGQHDPLFDWLAEEAGRDAMRWFLCQELATEAGFDDLVALTQLRMPSRAKLELANNYWDEMGRGTESSMHGPMLTALAQELEVEGLAEPTWESLALCNLLMGLAYNRRWAYHSIGALGAVELTAPDRARLVKEGLERLGVSKVARRYYALHEVIDERHYHQWSSEVLMPLVEGDGARAQWIAEGALMRLGAGQRTFERYRRHLWADRNQAA